MQMAYAGAYVQTKPPGIPRRGIDFVNETSGAPGGSGRPLGGHDETGTKIRLALETASVEFIDENGGGPGVRLRKRQ